MPQDPAYVVATQAWFIKANEDLREAEFVLTASPPFIGSSLFHSEQAVEKALKGFLTWHQTAFTTDDLEQLRSAQERSPPVQYSMKRTTYGVMPLVRTRETLTGTPVC